MPNKRALSVARVKQRLARAAGITRPYYKVEVLSGNAVRFHLYGGSTVTYKAPKAGAELWRLLGKPHPSPPLGGIEGGQDATKEESQLNLETMLKVQLLAIASRRGIAGRSRMTKAQLIEALS
jgi:hypothetical protein